MCLEIFFKKSFQRVVCAVRSWENTTSRAGGWGGSLDVTASYLQEGNPDEGPVKANTQRWEIRWMWPEVQRERGAELGVEDRTGC